ncbi:hypothetical protein Tco_0675064 [Tanacetum coccineum]
MRYGGICFHCKYDTNPNSLNFSDYPPQPQYETNICELCGNDAHFGYDCSPQVPFVYNQNPCFDQNFDNNFPLTSPNFSQQNLVCENCGGPHATFQCQPMNQNDSNSFCFDQIEPPQHFINNLNQFNNELCKMMEAYAERMNQQLEQEALLAAQREQELLAQKQGAKEEEELSPNFVFCQLIEEICGTKVCEEQKQKMEDMMLDLLKDCRQKEFYCIHNDVDDLIESALNTKLLSINLNSQRLDEEKQEVKHIVEQTPKHRTRFMKCLKNFKVIHKYSSISLNKTPQISSVNAITPDLPTEEPDNSLSMGDEHLSTIPEMESDEVIKSSIENLVPIPSESEGISDNTCDVPVCENSSTFNALKDHSLILSDSNNDGTSSDDDDFEDIEYKEYLEDILRIQDVILRAKLLNINRLIANIESLNDNPTSDRVLKSPSSFPIPVADSDSFFEEFDTSLSYSVNSLTEFETFIVYKEETSSGSTTTHANNSLPENDSFHFEIEPDQGELTNVVMETILGEPRVHMLNILPTQPTLDSDFTPSDDSLGSGLEVSFPTGSKNKIFDPGIFIEDCPDFEDSRARCFVHRSLALQILRMLILGIRYPNLID